MKEATGEFSMTVVTILAIVVIAACIGFLREPLMNFINNTFSNTAGNMQTEMNPAD